jgi:O-antigen/teichoic acid export membrane protein
MEQATPKVNRRQAALGTFASSTATTLLASVQALALMPLYLASVGPTLYGAWLATGEMLVLMLAFDMGIPNLLIQRIGAALAKNDHRSIGRYFATGLVILVSLSLLLGLALALVSPYVAGWVGIRGEEARLLRSAFVLSSVATTAMLINFVFQGLARGLQDTKIVNLSSFLGTLAGFATTLVLLLMGQGLWSIAVGVATRSVLTLGGSLIFLFFRVAPDIRRSMCVDREVAREFWRLSPPLFTSGLAYSLMNNSQVLLAAVILGPQSATIFGLTRKATEPARSLLDAVGHASYGGFAHLFAAGDMDKTRSVYREIVAIYLAVAVALMGAYVAVNPSLVGVWVSQKMFGGIALTVLFALATICGGWSYLTLSLYRSTDHHRQTSAALMIECACRLPIMIGLVYLIGLPGLPLGAMVTALASGGWAHRRINALLPQSTEDPQRKIVWMVRLAIFAVGLAICSFVVKPSWVFVLSVGGLLLLGAVIVFTQVDPLLHRIRRRLTPGVAR